MKHLLIFFILLSPHFIESDEAYAQMYSLTSQKSQKIVGSLIIGEQISSLKGFEISPGKDFLICKTKGVYYLSASIQPAALNVGINGHLSAWFELNQKPISASTSRLYVTEKQPMSLLTIPFLIELNDGDSIGARFASTNYDVGITYIDPPSINEPSVPSYTLTIFKVDS